MLSYPQATDSNATSLHVGDAPDAAAMGEEFVDLAALAARVADAPYAWIGLCDADAPLRIVGRYGVDAGLDAQLIALSGTLDAQLPRLTVADALQDACFAGRSGVATFPGIRFLHSQALFGENGRAIGVLAVADRLPRASCGRETMQSLDRLGGIGERLVERHALQRRNRIATQIMQAGFSAMIITDEHGAVTLANRAAEGLFGMRSRRMRGMPVALLFPPHLQTDPAGASTWLHATDEDAALGRAPQSQLHAFGPNGDVRTLEATRCTWQLGRGQGKAIILRDVTDDLAQQATLRQLALYDALTGLPNRTALVETLTSHLEATDEPLALALLGIDNFKTINDTLGHAAGDAVLQATASRLRLALPASAQVGRFGGDEFGVLFTGVATPDLDAHLIRMLATVGESMDVMGTPMHLEASVGLAVREDLQTEESLPSASELIARADLALYKAKARGGRQWCRYDLGMRREVIDRRMLEIELRRAYARGEFELHYQPQIDLANGLTFGAEALLRWRHPERGLLAPIHFLDVLAGSALANDVGRWIIRQACRDAATWPEVGGRKVAISINLFPDQVHETSLRIDVEAALAETGLDPGQIELEITETIALNPDDNASRALAALRDRGVRLSFDDFGTGFASLSMLQRFPIDRVKIDRSFVRDMMANRGDAAIVRSILLISHNMELHVTAEGVENHEQAELLRGLGCNAAQGFLYSPALAPRAFDKWLAAQASDPVRAPWMNPEPQDG
ncbi:putative bifunctional diguanylate cyclase/phosphodiesterase [Cognatilysobacter lacus]|uniref:EAL domain-containing protein n=1 Tax=Cognatilysobacter lacus TaxID=1643323 RepID=A0A5D8Z4T7_9GAMM|nr:GGDEF domain-containing phosphodiesterase [Lysobacter lacus]TZF89938.1 EAL domain-containing protein [Lysobacter lacus]